MSAFVVVPRRFYQRISDLTHNWSLRAVPPEMYSWGNEGAAFTEAYRRCGLALAEAKAMLADGPEVPLLIDASELAALRRDAGRYRWLRERDLDAISSGGVFAGMTPQNVIVNGDDLDFAIDAECLCPFCRGERRCAVCGDTGEVPRLVRACPAPEQGT